MHHDIASRFLTPFFGALFLMIISLNVVKGMEQFYDVNDAIESVLESENSEEPCETKEVDKDYLVTLCTLVSIDTEYTSRTYFDSVRTAFYEADRSITSPPPEN